MEWRWGWEGNDTAVDGRGGVDGRWGVGEGGGDGWKGWEVEVKG